MRTRGGIAALTIVAVVGAAVFAGALVAKPRIPATISLRVAHEGDDFVFRGRVRSAEPRCERRRVEITAGNGFDSPPVLEGTVRTDETGRYELRVPAETNTFGNYRAKALRKERRRFICKAARSEIVNEAGPPPRTG